MCFVEAALGFPLVYQLVKGWGFFSFGVESFIKDHLTIFSSKYVGESQIC